MIPPHVDPVIVQFAAVVLSCTVLLGCFILWGAYVIGEAVRPGTNRAPEGDLP